MLETGTISSAVATAHRIANEHRELAEAAERAILRRAAGLPSTPDDLAVLEAIGWGGNPDRFDSTIRKPLGRAAGVLKWRHRAGLNGDYEIAKVDAEAAAKARAERGPAILAAIDQLQAELAGLLSDERSAAAVVGEMELARSMLRKKVPPFVAEMHARRSAETLPQQEREIDRLRLRIAYIDLVTSLPYVPTPDRGNNEAADKIVHLCKYNLSPDHPAYPAQFIEGNRRFYVVSETGWQQYQRELAAERPGLVEALAIAEPELAAAKLEVDTLLDYWLNHLPWLDGDPELADQLATHRDKPS